MNDELLEKSGPETFGSSERCLLCVEHVHLADHAHLAVHVFDSPVVQITLRCILCVDVIMFRIVALARSYIWMLHV